jgi:prepilin-type N-terminal cleavage/methylation domain-containing protein
MHVHQKILKRQDGFTQIEVILAAAILAVLSVMAVKMIGFAHERWMERSRVLTAGAILNAAERWWEIQRSIPTINDLTTAGFVPSSADTTGMALTIIVPAGQPEQCLWSYVIARVTMTDPSFRGDLRNQADITYDAGTRTYTLTKPLYPKTYTDYLVKAIVEGCPIAWNRF